ncbi:phospholipid carrier-dependent glycosyltransferase [Chloroflexota bacterium]
MTGRIANDKDGRRVRAQGRNGAISIALFALLFSIYLLTFSGIYHASDEMSMLVVTDSLAHRGAWDIELLRWMGEQQGSFGPDGHLYSRKGIGTTLAALPHYWLAVQCSRLGNVQTAMLTNAMVTALTGVLVYLLLQQLRYGQGVALATALAYGLGTMAWPYARYLFSESLAGLGLMLSFYSLVRYGNPSAPVRGRAEGGDSDETQGFCPLLAGAGLALALLARFNNALVTPFLGLLLLVYLNRRHGSNRRAWIKPILRFGAPVLAALAIIAWYNWLRFGSPLTTGYLPEERFATPFLEGFFGLILSPGKGLLWYNPLLFAALAAWPAFFRRHRAEALLVAAVVLSNLAFYAPWYLWWAGHGWGPRFLVTILPFAILPLAPALEAALRHRLLAIGLAILAGLSVAVQLLGVAVDFNLYLEEIYAELGLYHPATLFDPALSPLWRQMAYIRLENLDLAWARGGTFDWVAFLIGLGLVCSSGLALWAAWRGKLSVGMRGGLLVLLGVGTVFSLIRYAPTGDVAQVAQALALMERPGEAAALTDPLYTEPFQDAYDGHLWVWGVHSKEEVGGEPDAVWVIGTGDPDPAAVRLQIGQVRMDLYPSTPSGQNSPSDHPFDAARLPVPPLQAMADLGGKVQLVTVQLEGSAVRQGGVLPLTLTWRALAPMDTSYTVFVQAVDETGAKAGQIDSLPCAGGCPTTTWRPGDLVGQRYNLLIGADAPPGHYQIIAGVYDLTTGERLPRLDTQGNAVGDHLLLGPLDVQP